jgi:hypothetical protein
MIVRYYRIQDATGITYIRTTGDLCIESSTGGSWQPDMLYSFYDRADATEITAAELPKELRAE